MALHCAATLLLVPTGVPTGGVGDPGSVVVEALLPQVAVLEALQALADLHRGERVVVPVAPEQLAVVLEHLGRAPRADGVVVVDIGDDGWALLPRAPG